jgi:Flp pilus assembly protein TadD
MNTARSIALIAFAAVVTACGAKGDAKTPTPGSDEALMAQGLDKLYKTNDPVGAQDLFRQILKHTPTHYGAHYQLAVSLDRGGSPVEARPVWDEMRKLAEAINDTTTLRTVRTRLAAPDTASQDAMMALGLYQMWTKADYAAAATQFRALLRRNPTHYGATYQLASALDRAGKKDDARPVWTRVLGMATQYKDDKTAQIARDHLK